MSTIKYPEPASGTNIDFDTGVAGAGTQRIVLANNDPSVVAVNDLNARFLSDAFGRLRVSNPTYVFDSQMTYDLLPRLYEPVTNASGASVTHNSTDRCALHTFAATPNGGQAILQSFEHFRYQPGRSQQVFATFNFIETQANTTKFIGYSTGAGGNGIEFQQAGSVKQFVLYSGTGTGTQTANQANWNLDKLDGTGASGITLNLTTVQILVIDFQALYVGRVRIGFDIGGVVVWAHQFMHANVVASPYLQSANLPIRAGMTCNGTSSTTMKFICASVLSEGGQLDELGAQFSANSSGSASSGARTHALSLQPLPTFNSITNRGKFIVESVDVLVTGASPVQWELVIGQALTGSNSFTSVDSTSIMGLNTAGTLSGSPASVVATGYIMASNQIKGSANRSVTLRNPITLDAAGNPRVLGTMTLLLTGIGGASAFNAAINWREIR
jgi:hypothetical protein